MESSKSRLGKGLGALIQQKNSEKKYILEVEIGKVLPNVLQPRKNFDDEKIKELAASIEQKGILQPIIVRERNGIYEIIAGERRFRAAKLVELDKVPVIVKNNLEEEEVLELAIIENVQREDLNPVEEGEAYKLLIEKYSYTQEELAKKLGKNRATITNTLRLLKLPNEIKTLMVQGRISSGHARALVNIEAKSDQVELAEKIIEEKLSVRDTEKLSKDKKESGKSKKIVKEKRLEIIEIENTLTEYLGTKVRIKDLNNKKGKVEIEFYSDGDLERIIETIGMKG